MNLRKMPSSNAQDRPVSLWFQKIENGEIKLPRFQRHQAWDRKRICSLMDTVIQNLPLGVTLILNVDKEQFISRYLATAPETGARVTEHLLDGQQRLTALWRVLHNNYEWETFFIYLSDYDETIDEGDETAEDYTVFYQGRWIDKKNRLRPLWIEEPYENLSRGFIPMNLFRPGDIAEEYENWVNQAMDPYKPVKEDDDFEEDLMIWMTDKQKLLNIIRDVRETISHFNLPYLALPSVTSKDTALQVFINMNTNSKPLSQYDIIRAEIEGVKGVSLDDYQNKLDNQHPNIQYYFELPFLILATSALIQDKLPNQRGMWDMEKDMMIANWDIMTDGLAKMATFLENQNIFDQKRLPTNAVLAVIAALYTHIDENLDARGQAEILLKKYLWSSFFTDRYENSAASHAYNDFIALKNLIKNEEKDNGELYSEKDVPIFNREKYPIATLEELLQVGWPKRENIRARGIMAVFNKLGAIDFADGTSINRKQLVEGKRHYHHVFPDDLLSKAEVDSYKALNCSLITDKTNLNISNKEPLRYLKERYKWTTEEMVNSRLRSHLIPVEELKNGGYEDLSDYEKKVKIKSDFEAFLKLRGRYVIAAVNELLQGNDITANDIIYKVEKEEAI
ncbi:GmrSD restriction endonuclease domain-containing protein [Xanthomarina gelatinilytica]|uniref:GmrSD restriction endonuclease domain-containing protein n=1 Tax=Xanthomarina gelatinilytica TaxID=1137281 RepID=UPI003AA922D5